MTTIATLTFPVLSQTKRGEFLAADNVCKRGNLLHIGSCS